jgi:ubiquinone/menaquinone biosynthesis C-methylase UbiE
VDLSPNCLAYCRNRFKEFKNIEFYEGSGWNLSQIQSESVDFIWSFNAFVHMDLDIIKSYMKEIKRVLINGGKCAFDHPGRRHVFLRLDFINLLGRWGKAFYQFISLGYYDKQYGDGWRSNVSRKQIIKLIKEENFIILKHQKVKTYCENKRKYFFNDDMVLFAKE